MPQPLSERTASFTDSVIRRMTRVSLKYGAVNLSQGFPDFEPPQAILERLAQVAREGPHQYSVTWGAQNFREALARKQSRYMGRTIDPDKEIVATCGSTEAMMCAMMTVTNPGDKVIVFSPFYENYGADTILSGAEPIYVPLHPPAFTFDVDELEAAFRQRPKALVLCNPSNPCGRVFTREELLTIAEMATKYDTYVITDEVYEHIVYAPHRHTYFATLPGMWNRTLSCSSLSKTYSITGWRLGYIIAPEEIIDRAKKVHDFLTVGCAAPLQEAVIPGLEFGQDYYKRADEVVDLSLKKRTIDKVITDSFEQIVYSLNQPTGARNYQAVFWNISYYDRYYFDSLFGNFYFPDGSQPDWEGLSWLQKRFMKWFNEERTKTVLTFPVETMAMLTENGECKDKEWGEFAAEMYSEGHSFFTYLSDNADSLSSCCRLRNEIQDNGFSYTLGAGGVSTGSKSVLTINLNRCIQYAVNHNLDYKEYLSHVIDLCHKVQLAYNENLKELQKNGMLPLFDAGYINLSRQYLTIGVNGLVEAAEFMGLKINDNPQYLEFVQTVLGLVEKYNKQYRSKEVMFNCEMIPAENVGVKHAKWDREDGYFVPRDCYNSYFYAVEDDSLTVIDKFKLHGAPYIEHLTGGSALHMNLEEHLSKDQYLQLFKVAAKEGCNYFTFNIPNTVCNDCGHIDKRYLKECPVCKSKNVDYLTRIIGYLKRVSNFSQARQAEAERRYYAKVR